MKTEMDDVMLDMETLGTIANSVIMSIGAVRFDMNSDALDDNGFYASVSIDSNLLAGRQISEATLMWWLKQDTVAQKVFFEPKQPLDAALESFAEWFGAPRQAERTRIWSNGADFDIPMIVHAFNSYGWDVPWRFFNARCMRTYKNLPNSLMVNAQFQGVKHNALTDAVNQARHLQAIQKNINTLSRLAKQVAA